MEAILLTLISEGSIDEGVTEDERRRRLRASGLLRVAFRSLREQIQDRQLRRPPFNDPLFWLMNRVEGELSRLVFARSVRKLRVPKSGTVKRNAADYLYLISYRTADLETAAARLTGATATLMARRQEARERSRKENVAKVFTKGSFVIADAMDQIPPLGRARAVIVVSNAKAFLVNLDQQADALLTAHPNLTHVLYVGDHIDRNEPPGSEQTEVHAVYVKGRGTARVICEAQDFLPVTLPRKSAADLYGIPSWLPHRLRVWLARRRGEADRPQGIDLLAWHSDELVKDALLRMAEIEI